MKQHHDTVKCKGIKSAILAAFHDDGKGPGDGGRHDPMREAAQRTALRANRIGKDLRDEDPDNSALRESKKSNKANKVQQDMAAATNFAAKRVSGKAEKNDHTQ